MVKYNRRRSYKTKRPSNRIIRAGTAIIDPQAQSVGYIYEAVDPQTASNFKIDLGIGSPASVMPYVLVYIPEGYDATTINYPAVTLDLYNPTKNVLINGVLTSDESEDHKYSRYGRKMAPGDRIALVFLNTKTSIVSVSYQISFSTFH